MLTGQKILKIAVPRPELARLFHRELDISPVLAQILINRKVNSPAEAEIFLKAGPESLHDPFDFAGMPKAVSLIKRARQQNKRVLVFGDYDVDGITSVAVLKRALLDFGIETEHYLPHRIKDGYGLVKDIAFFAKKKKIGLLITADCGTNNHTQIKELVSGGIEVIVTDHHEPGQGELPAASALINPKVKGSGYKFRDLAGVGVAYKLCQALTGRKMAEELDLVCLGTIADVVPLLGENRVIAREGLRRLTQAKRRGISALIEVSRIKDRKITADFVSFILGPRINASGRIDDAEAALRLLMSASEDEAAGLARLIEEHNRRRQKIEKAIIAEAEAVISKEVNFKEDRVIVLSGRGWHQGVLGIIASKLADRFYRPTILISEAPGLCKGSGRSIRNFHLFDALKECGGMLKDFGGHAHAVGLLIAQEDIPGFRKNLNRLANQKLMVEDLFPAVDIDMELGLGGIDLALAQELKLLEPFGEGNRQPFFYARGLKLKGQPRILGRDTLKFWVTDGDITYPVIGFGKAGLYDSLTSAASFDLVYSLKIDGWSGTEELILEAEDIFLRQY